MRGALVAARVASTRAVRVGELPLRVRGAAQLNTAAMQVAAEGRARTKDEDPYTVLTTPADECLRQGSSAASGLAWRLLQAPTAAARWKRLDVRAVRSLRFPGVFFVDVDEATAAELGARADAPLVPSLASPPSLLGPAPGMVRLWTYRLFLNTWAGKRRQLLLHPCFHRWWFSSELEAAFARDYRLFRDCVDVNAALGVPRPKTRPCLAAVRVGREQSPFSGVSAAPNSSVKRWRYRETWGQHRASGSYVTRWPGEARRPIPSGVVAAGLREKSFRKAVIQGNIPTMRDRVGRDGTEMRAAKPPYCNFDIGLRLPGESMDDFTAWLAALAEDGRGTPVGQPDSDLPDDAAGWSAFRADVLDELRTQAHAALEAQTLLDRAWEDSGMQHPALGASRDSELELLSVPLRSPLVVTVIDDDAGS